MRLKIKRKLLSKKTVIALIILLLASIILSYLIPQQFSTQPANLLKWQQAHPQWLPIIDLLGLQHLFTSPWFAFLLFWLSVTLGLTAYDQGQTAFKQTFVTTREQPTTEASEEDSHFCNLSEPEFSSILKKNGYLLVTRWPSMIRYVKHPWGYWGGVLLHAGMLIIIFASLLSVVNGKRSVAKLVERETLLPSTPWLYEENGLLADSIVLPEAVRLNKLTFEFWPQGGLKNLSSILTFVSPQGETNNLPVSLNQVLSWQGLRIYQQARFGVITTVILRDSTGGDSGVITLDFSHPRVLEQPSYGDYDFAGIPYHIRARYFADADKKSLQDNNPLLTLRFMEDNKVVNEISLKKNERGIFGTYEAQFVNVTNWAEFVFFDPTGMGGVFLGFLVFALGGILYYFTPPRQIYCRKLESGSLFFGESSRFKQHFADELQQLTASLREKENA